MSAIKVRDAYLGMGEEYKTLLSLFVGQNDNLKKHVGVDRVQSTFRKYRSVHAKLAGFICRNGENKSGFPVCPGTRYLLYTPDCVLPGSSQFAMTLRPLCVNYGR